MKKFLFINVFLFFYLFSSGQVLFKDDFSNGIGQWKTDSHEENWSSSDTDDAGCSKPELKFTNLDESFNGVSRMISPEINAKGNSTINLTFSYSMYDFENKTDYKMGVAVRSASGGVWRSAWTQLGGQYVQDKQDLDIDLPAGSSSFQICFYFEGNSHSIYDFCIDDVKVLGAGGDNDSDDDSSMGEIEVNRKKLPLFEVFSSSTCGPCSYFNSNALAPFMHSHPEVPVVKYQMNWPIPGDKYYTKEGKARMYPEVYNGIPAKFSDASVINGMEEYNLNSALEQATGNADFAIGAVHKIKGKSINTKIKIVPYKSGNYTLHVAIIENVTTGNAIVSKEPEFHNVMMKMVPDAQGTSVNFTNGTSVTKFFSQDMSATNVEEMDDIRAVVFIQDKDKGDVFQAVYSIENKSNLDVDTVYNITDFVVYPNPTTGIVNLQNKEQCKVYVSNTLGQRLLEFNEVKPNGQLDLTKLANGVYYISVTHNNVTTSKKIVINKDNEVKN